MNNSRPDNMVPLTVRAADDGTEIFLIDSGFNRLKSAVGRLQTEVRPGIYKVRFRAGEAQVDRIVEVSETVLRGRNSVELSEAPLGFSSAAPIPGTRSFSTCHEAAWRRAWQCPDENLGQGGRVFLMVRDMDSSNGSDSPSRSRRPWAGVTLSDIDGRTLCDMSKDGLRDSSSGVGTVHVELDPGVYILRINTSVSGVQKMAVAVCPGWQTQIVMAAVQYRRCAKGRFRTALRATLADAAVFMVKADGGGIPLDLMEKQLRLTELARQGLAQGRSPIRPGDLQEMLWAKYENPMLGIIGAHLLLRSPEPDWNTLETVVGNLERIVAGHPDIQALRLAVDGHRDVEAPRSPTCALPPMLSASWQIVVGASVRHPNLVPKGSLADRIGVWLVGGGPWLVWGRDERKTTLEQGKSIDISAIEQEFSPVMRYGILGRKAPRQMADSSQDVFLPPSRLRGEKPKPRQETLSQLLSDIRNKFPVSISRSGATPYRRFSATQRALIQAVAAQCVSDSRVVPEQVVRRMGVPVTTVIGIAKELLRRKGHLGNAAGRMG